MKRIAKMMVVLGTLGGAACDAEPESTYSELDTQEEGTDAEAPGTFASVYEPFDPALPDEETRLLSQQVVTVRAAEGAEFTADVQHEAEAIQFRFAHTLAVAKGAPYFAARSSDAEKIEVTYLGKASMTEVDVDDFDPLEQTRNQGSELPAKYRDEATWITGFIPATGSEFEVRIPKEFGDIVGVDAEQRGANRGTEVFEDEIQARKVVGPNDTRVLKGALNTRQSSSNLKKIVNVGGCTGALVGPHHVLTSAHCMYTDSQWRARTLTVGRNGSDWWGTSVRVAFGPANDDGSEQIQNVDDEIYWISSLYKDRVDNGGNPDPYDFGIIVTPDSDLATSSGWFGYAANNASHDDMFNRGYPSCTRGNVPPGCVANHLFGDTNNCGTGGFSGAKDSYGYSLYGYHSCDTNNGHSGSPLYRNSNSLGWVVRGVHQGRARNVPNTSDSVARNLFTLVTFKRSQKISFFKSAYP